MGAYLHWVVIVEKVAHPRGARSARGHLQKGPGLEGFWLATWCFHYNATKSCIYDTGVLVEPHNRQIYDTGVLVEWRKNVTKSVVLLGDSRVAGSGRAGSGRLQIFYN